MDDYTPTNRDRNREADRSRMKMSGRGLITVIQALEFKRIRGEAPQPARQMKLKKAGR